MIPQLLSRFAEESGPSVHITPSGVFDWNGITITNSHIYAWISGLIILAVLIYVGRHITVKPKKGFTQIVEVGTEFITGMLEGAMGSRDKALYYAPFFISIFFFIAFSNLLGLMPGVGEAVTVNGTPLLRPFTADLNGTLAIATVTLAMVQYFAIKESGPAKHMRHYFAGKLWNPLTYLIGIYEIFGEFIRLFSLALRLFLNVAIGEIIIGVFSWLGHTVAPITALPFLLLEMGVAILQAYIFVMLSVTYLSLAIKHDHDDNHEESVHSIAELDEATNG